MLCTCACTCVCKICVCLSVKLEQSSQIMEKCQENLFVEKCLFTWVKSEDTFPQSVFLKAAIADAK